MWILKYKKDILAKGTKEEMERELNDLIEVCLIEENRESFSIAEVNEGDF